MSKIISKDWRDYQEAVASLFRKQGCSVKVEEKVQGVRAIHAIDVYVSFPNHGINCNWVIECKLWKTKVPKEKVLALLTIVNDVGADRGIIISEKGFQKAALDASRQSNITLVTNLEEFERTVVSIDKPISLHLNDLHKEKELQIFEFPDGDRPHSLLMQGNKLFVGNWGTGNISIIDIDKRIIESKIVLDKYDVLSSETKTRKIMSFQPGNMAIADGRLFLGQIFSNSILVIDIATKSIVNRLTIPGGGDGYLTSSYDGKYIYFASNKESCFFIIESATYKYEIVPYPEGGRGSMSILAHPKKPYLFIGIQRGGKLNGKSYSGGNSFLAVYDLDNKIYFKNIYLAEITDNRSDDSSPACILYDGDHYIYVGMFQSNKGIYKIDDTTLEILQNISIEPNIYNKYFSWVDPLSLTIHERSIISLNRNNFEIALIDKKSGSITKSIFLGEAPNGPRDIVIYKNEAIVSYPEKHGLIFINLEVNK